MNELIHFVLFTGIFWLLYRWLLKKETFFMLNRIYLLIIPALAVALPFLKIDGFNNARNLPQIVELPSVFLSPTVSSTGAGYSSSGNLLPMLISLYGIGFLISSIVFLYKITRIRRLKRIGRQEENLTQKVIWLPDTDVAFSFWGIAFIGENLEGSTLQQILLHEEEHIRQKHSWDLCYYEVMRVFFWFNPFLYLLHRELTEAHEFAVDRKVVRSQSKKAYINSLLNANFQTQQLSFTNSFLTQNLLKTRIKMLYKKSSYKLAKLKYLSLLPLLLVMIFYVSCVDGSQQEDKQLQQQEESTTKQKANSEGETIPFQAVEISPEFLDSSKFKNEEERKKAFSTNIQKLVSTNFDTGVIPDEATDSIYRIAAQFKIDEEGMVQDIKTRSSLPELEKEAQRVLQKLPQFKPAQKNNHPVRVIYRLPIVFKTP